MTLNVHSVEFMEKIVPIFHLLDRVRPNFYPTWQEASEAVILLGIKSTGEYRRGGYRADPRLPSHPSSFYQDFPNWPTFLLSGNRAHIRDPYQTWQEASAATLQLKINGRNEYQKRYREDEKLPSAPAGFYTDFPGWSVFFGKEARVTVRRKKTYRTWSQAAIAAKRIGIKSIAAYHKRHTEDHRLPKNPRMCKDFPGWPKFFGKQ
jgi:hypothetical protein